MPNIVTHLVIGEKVVPKATPDFQLGMTLPDFVPMARDLRGTSTSLRDIRKFPALAEGVDFHQTTDVVFENLSETKTLVVELRNDLRKTAISEGAVRVCADAGTEILLDGVVMESGNLPAFNRMSQYVLGDFTLLDAIGDDELSSLIKQYYGDNRPSKYRNPEIVASALQFRLEMRGKEKLMFNEDKIPEVAEAFAKQQERLRRCANELIQLTVDGLKDGVAA